MSMRRVPIVIPALNPDERLVELVRELYAHDVVQVIVVDDGSKQTCAPVFSACADLGACVLVHPHNMGKGRALKDAFAFLLESGTEIAGCVTADADGQHVVDDVLAVADCLANHVDCELVLGVRNLHGDTIPVKSLVGNGVINACLALFCGLHVSDSQTGLRGISTELMARCLDLPGDRFEFEMQMLLACTGTIEEVPIRTIYEEEGPHMTHFAPLRDSWAVVKAVLAWKLQGRSRRASR